MVRPSRFRKIHPFVVEQLSGRTTDVKARLSVARTMVVLASSAYLTSTAEVT